MKKFKELREELVNLREWNASGHAISKAKKWLKNNGFEPHRHGSHPVYKHKITGQTVTAFNDHGKEVGAQEVRNTRNQIMKHHQDNKIRYSEL